MQENLVHLLYESQKTQDNPKIISTSGGLLQFRHEVVQVTITREKAQLLVQAEAQSWCLT